MIKEMNEQKFIGCWYCDNIIDHPDQIGLLHLGFPRCFVLIPNSKEFYFSTYDEFIKGVSEINWLDPEDIKNYSEKEKEEILIKLWNFSIAQEMEEENLSYDIEIDKYLDGETDL